MHASCIRFGYLNEDKNKVRDVAQVAEGLIRIKEGAGSPSLYKSECGVQVSNLSTLRRRSEV